MNTLTLGLVWISITIIFLSVIGVIEVGLNLIKKRFGCRGLKVAVGISLMVLVVTYIALFVMIGAPQ